MKDFPQSQYFRIMSECIGEEVVLRHWLSDLLDISLSSADRKIFGEVELKTSEFLFLSHSQPAATTELLKRYPLYTSSVVEDYSFNDQDSFLEYLLYIRSILSATLKEEGAKLFYIASDIPIFYFLSDHQMLDYKFRYWSKSLNKEGLQKLNPQIYKVARDIWELYQKMDSSELWSYNPFQKQFTQIKKALDCKFIKDFEYNTLKDRLLRFEQSIRDYITKEEKPLGGNYEVSIHENIEMVSGGLLENQKSSMVLGTYSFVNFVKDSSPNKIDCFKQDWDFHKRGSKRITNSHSSDAVDFLFPPKIDPSL